MLPILNIAILLLSILSVHAKSMNKDAPSSRLGATEETVATINSTATATIADDEGAILVIGDSWASLSGNYLGNVCGSSNIRPIKNDAKSGSTAKQWAYKRLGVEVIENARYEYTHVWLSIGGNDFLNNQCDMSIADKVAANVVNVIKQLVDASQGNAAVGEIPFPHDIKILYFGHSIPSKDVCGQGRTAELFAEQSNIVFDAIHNSAYAEYVTTFDASEMFVTAESSPLSDRKYFADAIHINEEGYMKLFSDYHVLRFFDCSVFQMAELATNDGQLPLSVIAVSALAIASSIILACYCLKKKE